MPPQECNCMHLVRVQCTGILECSACASNWPHSNHKLYCLAVCSRHAGDAQPQWCSIAAQHRAAQHSAAQSTAAQHSTAQHSTAQHSTAQHSTAQSKQTDIANTAQHGKEQHGAAKGHLRDDCKPGVNGHMPKALL